MKVLLVLAITLMAAATVLAYGPSDVAEGVTIVVAHTSDAALTEPLTMLLSGGLLLAMASAVRRFPV